MVVVKHPVPDSGKQTVLAMSAAVLGDGDNAVPLVATAELRQVALHYWAGPGDTPTWRAHLRRHDRIRGPGRILADAPAANWSGSLALTAGQRLAFLIYKRSLSATPTGSQEDERFEGLLMDRFRFDDATGTLVRADDAPRRLVPEDGMRVGFHHWAGYREDERTLQLLAQVYDPDIGPQSCRLRLYRADISDATVDLADPASWTVLDIDAGGDALDARMEGDRLVAVYRRGPWAFEAVERSGPLGIAIDDARHVDLWTVELDAQAGTLVAGPERLPGGEHPQVQSVDPLIVTFDRPAIGSIDGTRSVLNQEAGSSLTVLIDAVELWGKYIALRTQAGWSVSDFGHVKVPRRLVPRSVEPFGEWRIATDYRVAAGPPVVFGTLMPLMPARLYDLRPAVEDTLELSFLHHNDWRGLLVATRIRFDPRVPEAGLQSAGQTVYDINHGQVSGTGQSPSTGPENGQFAPFTRGRGLVSEPESAVYVVRQHDTGFDNTIGGLVCAVGSGTPRLVAYTDMGDGGVRVVFDAPDAIGFASDPELGRFVGPGDVHTADTAGTAWITLAPAAGVQWIETALPAYPNPYGEFLAQIPAGLQPPADAIAGFGIGALRSYGSGREAALDLLLLLLPAITPTLVGAVLGIGGTPPVDPSDGLSEAEALRIDGAIAEAGRWDGTTSTASSDDDPYRLTLAMLPATPVAGQQVDVEATWNGMPAAAFIDPSDPTLSAMLQWSFRWTVRQRQPGDAADDTSSWPRLTPTVPDPDEPWRIQVTPAADALALHVQLSLDARGFKQSVQQREDITPTTSDTLWALHDGLNTDDRFRIGGATMTLSKYRLTYATTTAGARSSVLIETLPVHDTQMRFVGGFGQGGIDHRFAVTVDSSDITLLFPVARDLLTIRSISASFAYRRRYTPGILTVDRRDRDPVTDENYAADGRIDTATADGAPIACALAMKPVGDAAVEVLSVDARVRMTVGGVLTAIFVGGLAGLLAFLAASALWFGVTAILSLAALAAGASTINPLVGVALAVVGIALVLLWLPGRIARSIERGIADGLTRNSTLRDLNGSGLMTYAGEGLAEAVARQVIGGAVSAGALPVDRNIDFDEPGRSRFRAELWQMVHVGSDFCRVLIRRS